MPKRVPSLEIKKQYIGLLVYQLTHFSALQSMAVTHSRGTFGGRCRGKEVPFDVLCGRLGRYDGITVYQGI